ncbi:unnamed protein product, partial [Pylaiella littoralis]
MPATQVQQNAAAFLLLAGMTFLEADEEEPLIQALRLASYNQADFLDGTARTGMSVPHAERWWEQTGRYLSSAQFKTAFRCSLRNSGPRIYERSLPHEERHYG